MSLPPGYRAGILALALATAFVLPAPAQFRFVMPPSSRNGMMRTTSRFTTVTTPTPATATTATRIGTPLFVPSVAAQSINPIFQIAPGLSLPQAAFNTMALGNALRSVPPYAFGFNPYPQLVANGGYGMGYSPALYGGYGGYGGYGMSMASMYSGADAGQSMASPYSGTAAYNDLVSVSSNSTYPAVSSSSHAVTDAHLVTAKSDTSLVSSTKPENPDKTRDVWIYDSFFSPATVMVPAGTTVRWINYGYHNHSVASSENQWDSGPLQRGAEFSVTFSKPGTYQYTCRFHPQQMTAKVIVTK
jgi:plastocyanin